MKPFYSAIIPPPASALPKRWFVFRQEQLLVIDELTGIQVPQWETWAQAELPALRQLYLGHVAQECHCYAVEVADSVQPSLGMRFQSLRSIMTLLTEELFALAGRAIQILAWDKNHQFCGRCGANMISSKVERVKQCPHCGLLNYPRIAPAIIVLISHGQQLLLSRAKHFPPGMFSVQAGFVEAGENLEEALRREILEEVGLEVQNIRYLGSQSWPFPNSLMIAFTAEYAGGELTVNHAELEAAAWYSPPNLPILPSTRSIARHLIENFLKNLGCNIDQPIKY
jgi:NAD+ diphosphatase